MTKTDHPMVSAKVKSADKVVMLPPLFDGTKPEIAKQHYERFNQYVVPKLRICSILRLGKPNLESSMLPNLKMGQHNLKIGLPNLKIGLPNLGILLDLWSLIIQLA